MLVQRQSPCGEVPLWMQAMCSQRHQLGDAVLLSSTTTFYIIVIFAVIFDGVVTIVVTIIAVTPFVIIIIIVVVVDVIWKYEHAHGGGCSCRGGGCSSSTDASTCSCGGSERHLNTVVCNLPSVEATTRRVHALQSQDVEERRRRLRHSRTIAQRAT
jgi:hypothetical protein